MTNRKNLRAVCCALLIFVCVFPLLACAENTQGMPTALKFVPDVYEMNAGSVLWPSVYVTAEDLSAFDAAYGSVEFSLLLGDGILQITGEYAAGTEPGVYTGGIKGLHPGIGVVSVYVPGMENSPDYACTVIVHSTHPVRIPEGVTTVSEESFCGIAADEVVLGSSVKRIESMAFAGCPSLGLVTIPAGVTYIAEDAFDGCDGVNIICAAESYAYRYALSHGLLLYAAQQD